MWVYSDYLQAVEEVKERNRFYLALMEIREIAVLSLNKEMPSETAKQFEQIFRKCDGVLTSNSPK